MKKVLLVVLSLVVVIATVGFKAPTVKKENIPSRTGDCPQCGEVTTKPESTGTKQEQKKAVKSVEKSENFKKTEKEILKNNGNINLLLVNVIEDTTQATVTYKVTNSKNDLSILVYFVDFASNEVPLEQKMYAKEVEKGELLNFLWTMNDEEFINVNINKEGQILKNNKVYSVNEYMSEHKIALEEKANEITSRGSCEWAVGLLCAAGTAGACYGICGITAIVNVLGAAGCAVACSVIFGGGGCIVATQKICGK